MSLKFSFCLSLDRLPGVVARSTEVPVKIGKTSRVPLGGMTVLADIFLREHSIHCVSSLSFPQGHLLPSVSTKTGMKGWL